MSLRATPGLSASALRTLSPSAAIDAEIASLERVRGFIVDLDALADDPEETLDAILEELRDVSDVVERSMRNLTIIKQRLDANSSQKDG